jgi:uncharacterized integral membrane protein
MIVVLALAVLFALCIHENAGNLSSMSLFGHVLFTDISTPIVILFSFLAGIVVAFPCIALSRASRARRKAARTKARSQKHAAEKDAKAPAKYIELPMGGDK